MATKMYLHDSNLNSFTATEQSTALPSGTANSLNEGPHLMNTRIGVGTQVTQTNSLAQATPQSTFFAKYLTHPITSGDISANTWTIALSVQEASTNANAFLALSVYIQKSDGTVRGFVYDSVTALGTEWALAFTGQVITFSGSAVTGVVSTDRLVCEVWSVATQAMSTAYLCSYELDGVADVTAASTTTFGSYLSTPQALTFSTPVEITNTLEGGSNGTAITNANSGATSGTAFNLIIGTATFDNSTSAHGTLSAKVTSGSQVWWDPGAISGDLTDHYGRAYIRKDANPASISAFLDFQTVVTSCSLRFTTTGTIQVSDSAGANIGTSTTVIPNNQWCRVEWHVIHSASVGQVVLRIYLSQDSTTIDETVDTGATRNTGTAANVAAFISPGGNNWFDDLDLAATTWPGPSGAGPAADVIPDVYMARVRT